MAGNPSLVGTHATFIRLVVAGTGLSFRTVVAWVASEGGPVGNPLNIGPGKNYGSGTAAAAAVIALLRKDVTNKYGYRDILGTAGQSDAKQLNAIIRSSWEGSHYEGGKRLYAAYNTMFPSGKITFSPGDITIKNPVSQIDDAAGLVTGGVGSILGKLASTNTWIRVILVILGAIALIGALAIFTKELAK